VDFISGMCFGHLLEEDSPGRLYCGTAAFIQNCCGKVPGFLAKSLFKQKGVLVDGRIKAQLETRVMTALVSHPFLSKFARHKPDDVSNDIEVALPETSLGGDQAPAGDHPPQTGPRMTRSTTVRLSATGHVRSFPQQESLRKKPPDEDEDSDSDTEPAVEAESLQVKRRAFECRVKSWRSSTCMGNRQSFTCSPLLSVAPCFP
jgi:hypothetical protein